MRERSGGATLLQGGRRKAYRPLPVAGRRSALEAALAAYARGDFFLAHELLEPPWMGAADPAERDLYQGLIKLAAAMVHAVRGNPAGVVKNLRGAHERLECAVGGLPVGPFSEPVLRSLLAAIDERIVAAERIAVGPAQDGPARGRPARGRPLPIEPPSLPGARG